jgi:hypothetical protein
MTDMLANQLKVSYLRSLGVRIDSHHTGTGKVDCWQTTLGYDSDSVRRVRCPSQECSVVSDRTVSAAPRRKCN